jgi:cytochrome c6
MTRRLTVLPRAAWAGLFAAALMFGVPNDGAQLFSVNCVVCHGEDGKGTDTGKALMTPDLHSDAVQKQTNSMLTQIISEGKNNMPPFMSTLSKADIQSLVVYVRTFAKKAK